MPSDLRTTPQTIASAGMTVDGREITEQDIDDMVETYDPAIYGARINLSHYGDWGAWAARDLGIELEGSMLGDVIALSKGKSKDGQTVLNAVLCPNASLLKLNQADQAVYYSVEIDRDFLKTGQTYLTGLAMTDYPASTRTTRAQFTSDGGDTEASDDTDVSFPMELAVETLKNTPHKKPSFFQNLFHKKDNDMKPDEFAEAVSSALSKPMDKMTQAIEKMTQQINAPSKPKEEADSDSFDASTEIKTLSEKLDSLTEKFDQMSKQEGAGNTPGEENIHDDFGSDFY
ncbi:GPO family capsid scaffolding protein [Algicola sagamiensis]|uniref:GPO family capsid scaffolding protein n=1 Tax=Algicola sagamiensis TaxID=163869 RepID=UPI00037AF7B8|nr:GPO family capsid scaffolding protein [Algicola sagamiensis]